MTDGIAGCSRSPCSRRSRAPGPITTYRSLLAGVNARVEREVGEQRPVLEPIDVGGPADLLVFDGTILRAEATFHVTRSATGFEVDAGSIHGLRSASGGEAFDLACLVPGTAEVAGLVRVREAGPSRSVVEPLGWQPADIAYEAVIASVPLPAAVVRFDRDGPADAYERIRQALSSAGPGGTPSPYVEVEVEGGARGAVGAGDERGPGTPSAIGSSCASPPSPTAIPSIGSRPAGQPRCAPQAVRCSASSARMGRRSWPTSRDSG